MTSSTFSVLISEKPGEPFNVQNVLYENRYCNQDDFRILVCGVYSRNGTNLNEVYELKGPNLECTEFPSMLEARFACKTAVVNSDIFVVGGFNNANTKLYSAELYENNKKSWSYKAELPDKRTGFRICSFKQNVYITGGIDTNDDQLKSCFVYDMKCNSFGLK